MEHAQPQFWQLHEYGFSHPRGRFPLMSKLGTQTRITFSKDFKYYQDTI